MSQPHLVDVPADVLDRCYINNDQYVAMYERSINDPDGFWAEQADIFIDWTEKWVSVREADMTNGNVSWFSGGKLNISYNCIDRHLAKRADQIAIIWEGDDAAEDRKIT